MSETGAAGWAEKVFGSAGSHTAGENGAIATKVPTVTGGRRRSKRRQSRQRKQRKSQKRRIRGGRK
jgi:hypothetical protein